MYTFCVYNKPVQFVLNNMNKSILLHLLANNESRDSYNVANYTLRAFVGHVFRNANNAVIFLKCNYYVIH